MNVLFCHVLFHTFLRSHIEYIKSILGVSMKLRKRLLACSLSVLLFITGCTKFTIPTNANAAFKNFTLCLFQEEVSSNTINLHYSLQHPEKYGITDIPITLGSFDFNETAALAAIENWDNALHKFSYQSLSDENQLTYDILSHYFALAKENTLYHLYEEPLSPVTGIHAQLPVLLAEYQFLCADDVETYLLLLGTLPEYFASLVRFEQQKSASGLFMSDALVDAVVEQCNAFVAMGDDNYLLSTFEERVNNVTDLTSEESAELIRENKKVISKCVLPAYESLAASLTSLKGTGKSAQGLCHLPDGKNYYTHLIALDTGSGRSVAELKTLIRQQIAVDLLDRQKILQENPSILETSDFIPMPPDMVLQTLETKISKTFPKATSVNVQVKYVPKALEAYLSPAFYLIPSIDNFMENTIYINQAYSLNDIDLFTTLAHEGYPGHLYQTTYFANTNPDPIRTLLNFSGYVEGWATYAEMCAYYLTSLEKPYATLLQKNNSFILGLYAAADIGIHYDGWSVSDTAAFFSDYGIDDMSAIQEIYEYIVGDPANYLMYYVGYLEMLELKKEMFSELGNDFSQKEFHKQILEIGPAPFEIIKKHLPM